MPAATPPQGRGFHEVLDDYRRYRAGYSAEVVAYLADLALADGCAGRYLDVACGTGLLLAPLARRARVACGVDLSPAMQGEAARACPAAACAVAAAERLPFRDGQFDLVTVAQAYHWLDPKRAHPELLRVLRPGGTLAVVAKYPAPEEPYVYLGDEVFRELNYPPKRAPYGVGNLLTLLDAGFVDYRRRVFAIDLPYTVENYVGWMRSREVMRLVARDQRAAAFREFEARLRALVAPAEGFVERNLQYVITVRRAVS